MQFNKLVRDNIPDIIKKEGYLPQKKTLCDEQYLVELDAKLNEEVREYQESKELAELADILEVIDAICIARGYSIEELVRIKSEKYTARGGFANKIFLISKTKCD